MSGTKGGHDEAPGATPITQLRRPALDQQVIDLRSAALLLETAPLSTADGLPVHNEKKARWVVCKKCRGSGRVEVEIEAKKKDSADELDDAKEARRRGDARQTQAGRVVPWYAAAALLVVVLGILVVGLVKRDPKPPFDDVGTSHPAAEAIAHLQDAGLVVGVGDNLFEPDRAMTRCEAAVILVRLADLGELPGQVPTGDWCSPWMASAIVNGLMTPLPDFNGPATRADIAQMIWWGSRR